MEKLFAAAIMIVFLCCGFVGAVRLPGEKTWAQFPGARRRIFHLPGRRYIASLKKIKEKPDEIKRVIRGGIKANRYIRAEREGTIQFLMEWQKVNRETATANYDGAARVFNDDGSVPEAGLRLIIDEAKKTAKVEREVSLNDVADLSILREAQKELGIKGR